MKTKLIVRATQLLPVFLIWCTLTHAQQLKLGDNPSALQKSALLELESKSQGLLLPRITDTTTGAITAAPDGMIIYLTTNKSLCIRSNGHWRPLLPEGYAVTSLNGQTIAIQQLATTNAAGAYGFNSTGGTHTLNIPDATATNSGFINIGAQTLAGAKTFNNTLTANQDVYLRGIGVDNTKDSVLLIDGGRLLKKQLTGLAPIGAAGGDLSGTYPNPGIAAGAVTGTKIAQAGATSGQVLKWNGTTWAPANDEGIGLSSQTANTVLAAPNGSNGMPTFRSLVPADMTLNYPGRLVGRYDGGAGGAQEVSLDATLKMYPFGGTAYLYVDSTQLRYNASKIAGTRVLSGATTGQVLTYNGTAWAAATPATTGLSSVGLTMPGMFTVGNSPLTTNGVIGVTLNNQAANSVFAAPTTGTGVPSFRALGSSDIQGVTTQRLLGRYATGTGAAQEVTLDNTLKLTTTGTLYADSALALWNAGKVQGVRVAGTAPTTGQVLKFNGTFWEPNADNDGGATYERSTTNDARNATADGSTTVMKIWQSPVNGTVTNGPGYTNAHAWSIMAFNGSIGTNRFTTQLYFDKNTMAIKEWGGLAAPLTTNAGNGWYKAILTNGDNKLGVNGILYGKRTSDASAEAASDSSNFVYIENTRRLGIATNNPEANLDVNGTAKIGTNGSTINSIIRAFPTLSTGGNIGTGAAVAIQTNVPGALTTATVFASPTMALPAGLAVGYCYVSSNNVVQVVIINHKGNNGSFNNIQFNITVIN